MVSRELFDKVCGAIEARRTRPPGRRPSVATSFLQGLVKCAACRAPRSGSTARGSFSRPKTFAASHLNSEARSCRVTMSRCTVGASLSRWALAPEDARGLATSFALALAAGLGGAVLWPSSTRAALGLRVARLAAISLLTATVHGLCLRRLARSTCDDAQRLLRLAVGVSVW